MNELKKKPEHISINIYFINILTYLDFYWFICVGASNGDILGVEAGVQLPEVRNVPDQWGNVLGWSGSIQNITKIFVAIYIGADQPGLRGPQGGCTPNFSSGCIWWRIMMKMVVTDEMEERDPPGERVDNGQVSFHSDGNSGPDLE